jgi:Family of unknown function (DUF6134)
MTRNWRTLWHTTQGRSRDAGRLAPVIAPSRHPVERARAPAGARASIGRRRLLISAIAGAAGCALPRVGRAAPAVVLPSTADNQRFSVLYKGDRIGAHTVAYSAATGETRIVTEIDLLVKAFFLTLFSFSHRSEERWRDGRLVSLRSETVEHGETLHVTGAPVAQGFRVVSKAGPFIAREDALTSNNLWTPAVLQQETVIDAYHGGVIGVSARRLADEQIPVAGRLVGTTRYRFITPYLAGSIWYDAANRWVQGEFERDAAQIVYRLDPSG